MNDQTKAALQAVINDLLLTVPRQIAFDNGLIDVDYGLMNEGVIVTDEYFSAIMDGTVHLVN